MNRRNGNDDYEPLLQEEGQVSEFELYERERRRKRICLVLSVCSLLFVGLVVGLFFLGRELSTNDSESNAFRKFQHAAVASDVAQCSTIGKDTLEKGGNAVDAAIASLLCMGLADAQSMGIGGGFFMTVYNRTTGETYVIDARETAPELANETMYENDHSASLTGPLSIAVPGEIRGYWMAHQKAGALPWADLFTPAIEMAEKGFKVPQSLASAFQDDKETLLSEPSLRVAYLNPETNELYKAGETLRLPELADTLKSIRDKGQAAFYENGTLLDNILQDLEQMGSIITRNDLNNYKPLLKTSKEVKLENGLTIFSPPPPSSGALLSFMLNVLEGYNMTSADLKTTEKATRTYHRIIETFKFAYAKRTDLGDEDFVNVTDLVANLTSRDYANYIRSFITDNMTHNVSYYGPTFYSRYTTSTAHLSVVDADGSAVSVTSTVNNRFGSKRRGNRTGIVFNDEMDDFSSPNITNEFGIPPSPANFIKPGKRPLSSMCPAVIVDSNGDVRLVVGAAGGSRITTATAFVSVLELLLGKDIGEAVTAPRLHHQLLPDEISYEEKFDSEIIEGLEKLGHKVVAVKPGRSIVQAISRHDGTLLAASDYRKGGVPDGY